LTDEATNEKCEEQVLSESSQFWSVDELDDEKIAAIADPVAQGHAWSALVARRMKEAHANG